MSIIVGIDEVGRGCWAGPLVAAAVILHKPIRGLKDSKMLTPKQRDVLAKEIHNSASVGVGWVDAAIIDMVGLTVATTQAMTDAIQQITPDYDEIIIDGHFNFLYTRTDVMHKVRTIIKADQTIPVVSAASIVAKVARDNYMREIAQDFPNYQFEKHVGYGTKLHHDLLKLHGASSLHRQSFKPLREMPVDSL